jgi:AbrB family looped-hinge helix DNA binding protein
MVSVMGRVTGSGRISIPAEIRKAAGIENDSDVVIQLEGKEIRIRTVDEVVRDVQARAKQMLAGKKNVSVAAFIQERRREAKRE